MNAEELGRMFSTEILPVAIGLYIGYRILKKNKESKLQDKEKEVRK